MTTTEDLPNEVLQCIMECIPNRKFAYETQRSLRNACFVSKRWRSIAQPILFNHWNQFLMGGTNVKFIPCFIRSLVERPDLAAFVRKIAVGCLVWNSEDEPQLFFSPDMFELFVGAAERLRPGDEAWQDAISSGELDSISALMLYLLPNLHTLEFEVPFSWSTDPSDYWVLRFIDEATGQSYPSTYGSFLPHLRTIIPRHYDTEDGFDMRGIAPFFNLQSLREVNAVMMGGLSDQTWPVENSNVKSLRLYNSAMEDSDFTNLINSFKALEVLEWSWSDSAFRDIEFDISGMDADLVKHATSLKRLCLDATDATTDETGTEMETASMGSLAAFTELKSVTISAIFLVGSEPVDEDDDGDENMSMPLVQVLPRVLEKLEIIDVPMRLPRHLLYLAQTCVGVLTNLKVVRCPDWDESDSDIRRQDVIDAFRIAGVDFTTYTHVLAFDHQRFSLP